MPAFFKTKTFFITFGVLLILSVISALYFQETSEQSYDPIPRAIDDESVVHRTAYGYKIPLFYKELKYCFCPPPKPHYRLAPGAFVYLLGITTVSAVTSLAFSKKNK